MFSQFQTQMTYYGTLDDVVDRYPWPNPIDLRSIRQQLITSAIYGKRILINDGYLVANPLLVPDIKDINRSLVGTLLTSGIARLFTRDENADLAKGILRTAERVSSHRRITEDRNLWPRLERQLDYLSGEVRHRSVLWPRDKNMGHLFYLLMERIAALPGRQRDRVIPRALGDDFDAIFRLFSDNIDKRTFDGARTVWEEYSWRHFAGHDIDPHALGAIRIPAERLTLYPAYDRVTAMMNVANEVYHLAYSVGAAHSLAGKRRPTEPRYDVGVSTALVDIFPDLARAETPTDGSLDEAKVGAFNQLIISLPPEIEFGEDFTFVRSMQSDDDVRESRKAYLQALEQFANDRAGFREAKVSRDSYAKILANLMAPALRLKKRRVAAERLTDLMLATLIDPLRLMPVVGWSLSTCVDHFRTRIIERMLVRRLESALAKEGIVATQDRGAEPLVRKYGFYLGPLKYEGAAGLAARVGPHPALRSD
jgi:hypothetical protein